MENNFILKKTNWRSNRYVGIFSSIDLALEWITKNSKEYIENQYNVIPCDEDMAIMYTHVSTNANTYVITQLKKIQ